MNWLSFLLKLVSLTPTIVAGVQTITDETKDGTTKKKMATDSLNLATGLSEVLLSDNPEDQQLAAVASTVVSQTIDAAVQDHKDAGTPGFTPSTPPPPKAPASSSAAPAADAPAGPLHIAADGAAAA